MDSKKPILALGLAGLIASGTASAEYIDEDMLKVTVRILPNIAVSAGEDVELTSLRTGEIEGSLPFRIDSNSPEIEISVQASHLYKGSDPNSANWIELLPERQAEIYVKNGDPAPHVGSFSRAVDVHGGFMGYVADPVLLEGGDRGSFSEDLEIGVVWSNEDDELPVGEYTGYVKIIGVVMPGGDEE